MDNTTSFLGTSARLNSLSEDEKQKVVSEFPVYNLRKIEQTYLTLPEWYQVYSYNEFGDFLINGGRQTDFPFLGSIKNFWCYYSIALQESRDEKFNWQYNFVTWMIGVNLTAEYSIKSIYENTVGRITQLLGSSDTEADKFIANSWNNYAEKMYQTTWYNYPYFNDLQGMWTEIILFDRHFVRNLERKIAFSVSYLIKGTYAKLWLLTAVQKENETFSVVYSEDKGALAQDNIEILRDLENDRYLIKTERYAGFKDALQKLLAKNVRFIEIQSHGVISLSYLSKKDSEPFGSSDRVEIIDKRKLFYNPNDYVYRVTLKAQVQDLNEIISTINTQGNYFEMIYDF